MDPRLPIRSLDYTVIFAREMSAMREFYGTTLGFPLHEELGPQWVEFRIGSNLLALTERGVLFDDPSPPAEVTLWHKRTKWALPAAPPPRPSPAKRGRVRREDQNITSP